MSEHSKVTVNSPSYTIELTDEEFKALAVILSHVTYKTENPFYHIAEEVLYLYPDPNPDALRFEVWDDGWENSEYKQNVEIEFREDWNL